MKARTKNLLVAVMLCGCFVSTASADLTKRIDSIVGRKSQRKVQFSINVVEADSGKIVYSHNARKALVPASNMKIITTAAALKYLGPNYEYKTKVGLCEDTLVIIGSGDPLLGDKATDAKYRKKDGWILEDMVATLKQKHVKTIKDIIIDSSIFDDQRVHSNWSKKELNRPYACEVSGLNYNGNCIGVTAKNSRGKVVVSIEPVTDYVKIINKVRRVKKGKVGVAAYRTRQPNKIILEGKCKKQQGPFSVAIERPAAFFGFLSAENLAKAGISVEGKVIEKPVGRDCKLRLLRVYRTPITECLVRCNKDSFGLAAEALLKTIAAHSHKGHKNGSWADGRRLIGQYLLGLGIRENEFHIDDGSGLSRQNKLSANALTKVLSNLYKSKNWKLYKDSLAVGGVDGTIRRYFKEEKYKGKIFGKTGYITGVKSLSGVCSTADGDYIFSILTNNTNGKTRTAINDIVKVLFD
jgi:D-alanyl-D-alanine carboxypeptidase/D-alanyl-D-alanine-endopeptidase (penicillin-binding protein 4)